MKEIVYNNKRFAVISIDEYNSRTTKEAVIAEIKRVLTKGELEKYDGIDGVYNSFIEEPEALKFFMFDLSYSENWDEMRSKFNLTNESAYIFDYIGKVN